MTFSRDNCRKKNIIIFAFYCLLTQPFYTHTHEEDTYPLPAIESDNQTLNVMQEDDFTQAIDSSTHEHQEHEEEKNKKTMSEDVATNTIDQSAQDAEFRIINNIFVYGNKQVPTEAILTRIPFRIGEPFDPQKTGLLIRNLYYELKRFRNITIKGENVGADRINLYIIVDEKKILKEVQFKGNKQVSEKEIRKKIDFSAIPAVDQEELQRFATQIKKLYIDKGYYLVEIQTELVLDPENKAIAIFTIKEPKQARIKQIIFKGNDHVSSKQLRKILFTQEDWALGFLSSAGIYIPDRLEADKHVIEQFYQSNGYLHAKVIDVDSHLETTTNKITLTFEIQEGDLYTIKEIKAPGNEIVDEAYLLNFIPIRPGELYSREKIAHTIQILETIWGNLGYMYTHIEPSIQPDEETKTVSLAFYSEPGRKVFLNKITIKGNKKTRDKIIRRQFIFEEGDLITNPNMEISKNKIESLGYFEPRDGVNWKVTRLSEDLADLELLVNEKKTGNAHLKFGIGGSAKDIKSPASSLSVEANIADTNLFGSGIQFNLTGIFSHDEKSLFFNLTQPWLFDRPIFGKLECYHQRVGYDTFKHTLPVNEKHTGGNITSGFATGFRNYPFFNDTFFRYGISGENISYEKKPKASVIGLPYDQMLEANIVYQSLLDKLFYPGQFLSLFLNIGQDKKNHPMHPTCGHTWLARALVGIPILDGKLGFYKFDFDFNWYTPLIGDYDLIFHLHSYLGFVNEFKKRYIPYRELYHIGGPASVRGFLFGQIGPQFIAPDYSDPLDPTEYRSFSDSIGGRKTIFFNAELIFPISPDFSMKGILFYDGGAGWDNPYACSIPQKYLKNNSFDYRHAVGFGFRVLQPAPIRVDWGFKLDTRKGEVGHEVHFGMNYDW